MELQVDSEMSCQHGHGIDEAVQLLCRRFQCRTAKIAGAAPVIVYTHFGLRVGDKIPNGEVVVDLSIAPVCIL